MLNKLYGFAFMGHGRLQHSQVFDGTLTLAGISLQDDPSGLSRLIHGHGETRGEIVGLDIVVVRRA